MEIVILSPHLDDAALSCSDHIHKWNTAGHNTTVVSIFSSFNTPVVSDYLNHFMKTSGIASVHELEKLRKQEDINAMKLMGCHMTHLNFIDAGYRQFNGITIYTDYKALCPFILPQKENIMMTEVSNRLSEYKEADIILVPLGVGGHVDHIITRVAAEKMGVGDKLAYYVDFPYALNPLKWRVNHINSLFSYSCSLYWISKFKRSIFECYPSQIPYLFKMKPQYPEIILFKYKNIKLRFMK